MDTRMSFWHLVFHFPDGGVYSNIVASVIWTTPSFIAGLVISHLRLKKHINAEHQKSREHLAMHMDKLHSKIDLLRK